MSRVERTNLSDCCFGARSVNGFGIVELMIAMALGAVILLAVSELFLSNSRSRAEIEKNSRQVENGRFVLQMLAEEVGNAGFAGESASDGLIPASLPETCVQEDAGNFEKIQGALITPVLGGADDPGCLASASVTYKKGSEYIALRRGSSAPCEPGVCEKRQESYFMQVSSCGTSDPGSLRIAARADVEESLKALARSCDASNHALIHPFLSRLYFINNASVLYRAELVNTSNGPAYQRSPMIEGIEQIAFEYGVDDDEDGVPDAFLSTSTVSESQWANIIAVRIWVLARNLEPSPGYKDENEYRLGDGGSAPVFQAETDFDSHKRQIYSTTARVNNAAGRRL